MPLNPVTLPPGRARLATGPVLTALATAAHHDGDRARRLLGSPHGAGAGGHDNIDLEADELGSQSSSEGSPSRAGAELEDNVLALQPAEFA